MRGQVYVFGVLLLGCLAPRPGRSQVAPGATGSSNRYWVAFCDKAPLGPRAARCLSPAALARRRAQGLPLLEATDLPVRPAYVAAVRAHVDTLTVVSRWLNGAACRATPAQAAALRQLPGVAEVRAWPLAQRLLPARYKAGSDKVNQGRETKTSPTASWPGPAVSAAAASAASPAAAASRAAFVSPADYLLARQQTAALGRAELRRAGLAGKGVRVAVFDVGFRGLDRHPAFAGLFREGRVAGTYDFLKNRPDVFLGGAHGTEVMGCLAGRLPGPDSLRPGPALGLAPAATYLLARTEGLASERFSEEEAWLRAAEWADQQGADIISSSLAYTEQRYFPEQMDGRHSLVGRAATLAARKGMLVVSAAGNDGDDDWVRIGTPADADSVLAVGGLDPATGLHVSFSSVGPSADRRLKPDLSAFGIVLTTTAGGGYERVEGTSFAAPLVAGLAACARQAAGRALPAMQLYRQLREAGELFPYYDYAHGYGRPGAGRLLARQRGPVPTPEPTFDFVTHDSLVAVVLRPAATLPPARPLPLLADDDELSVEAASWLRPTEEAARPPGSPTPTRASVAPVGQEQAAPADAAPALPPYPSYPARLYWHLASARGVLRRYEVRAATQRLVLQLPRRLARGGDVLRVYYQGYTGTYSE
ncbi:S8 family serine peptidase [Hymenobacter sp. RP-2-7]|uniref:S8 family serine peptidase n=1 Tax=Hymenobacter polaris TaxID=2682546 RepID=A0A7Y0FLB4_9BACT|nr:S8 family serine peptidase [Hymenobacter polaris]NML64199.1 S8 family serine peptidase [Hymenobacter polaris]